MDYDERPTTDGRLLALVVAREGSRSRAAGRAERERRRTNVSPPKLETRRVDGRCVVAGVCLHALATPRQTLELRP